MGPAATLTAGRVRSPWVLAVALAQLVVLLATSTRYGYHRDELYFIVAGGHPAFGYPDQPPLVPLLCWSMNHLAPDSLLALRAPSAVIAAATTLISAEIAAETGARRRGQVIAAICTAVSGFALAVSHLVSTTTPDMLSTTLLGWLAVRAAMRRSGGALITAGIVVGLGIEAKPQVGLVAAAMVAAVLAIGPRELLRRRAAAAGAMLAVLLAAPYVIWQARHGWPQQTVARNIAGDQEGGRIGFIPFQLVMVSPLLVPVWVAGLLAPWRRPGWACLRFVTVTYLAVAVVYLLGDGHAYYLASLYPTVLGLGGAPADEWLVRGRRRVRVGVLAAAVVVGGAFNAVIALPLLPERELQGSAVVALNSAQEETVGWPRFVDTISRAWRRTPAGERPGTVIFTANYGEAGALDVLGGRDRLPHVYGGQNGFAEWGIPPPSARYALLVGYDGASSAAPQFRACRTEAVVDDGVGLDNQEQGLPVMLCRPAASWPALWPSLRHLD